MLIDVTLKHIIHHWLMHLQHNQRCSPHTIRGYITDVYYFCCFLNSHLGASASLNMLENLRVTDFRAWLADMRNNHKENSSLLRAVSAIKNFYTYLQSEQGIINQEISKLKMRKTKKALPRSLSIAQAMECINALPETTWQEMRDKAVLLLLYGAGLRISEALNIAWTNVQQDHVLVMGKGGKERFIPLLPQVYYALQKYKAHTPFNTEVFFFMNNKGDPLTPDNYRFHLRKLELRIGMLERPSPHAFRHSFATHLLAQGVNIRVIQELLGHESISSTQIYTKVDMHDIIEAYKKAKSNE